MQRSQNYRYYVAAIVSLVTFVVYLPSLHHEFVEWDDAQYVVENLHIRSINITFIKWAFANFHASNWHPLTWISHAIDYAIWGLNPLGHHLTNVILHAINTYLVVLLIIGLLNVLKETTIKKGLEEFLHERTILITGGVTGLLFGLHPLHVESVVWVAERKDLLCALFVLLSIILYTKYVNRINKEPAQEKSSLRFFNKQYFIAFVFFILALLSKPMAVTLPFVMLILDWYPFKRIRSLKTFQAAFIEKIPFIALSLISSVLTVLAQRAGGALVSMESAPLSTRVIVGAGSLIAYLWKMIWPLNLIPFYPYPTDVSLLSLEYLVKIVFVIGITILCIVTAKKQRLWLSVWIYYVVTLIPVIGIVQVGRQAMADRYTYLPSLGPFLIMGLGVAWASRKMNTLPRWGQIIKLLGAAIFIFAFVSMSYLTFRQISIWNNSIRLWSYVIGKHPERVHLVYYFRGLAFLNTDQADKAIEDFDMAIALDPYFGDAFLNRGNAFEKIGKLDKAIEDFDKAIALSPSYEAYFNRGITFEKMGLIDKAIADYDKAIAFNPYHYEAYFAVGKLYGKAGLFDKAIEYFNKYIAINPKNAESYNNRGLSYVYIGQDDRALEDFNKAIALDQNIAVTYRNRGNLYLRLGNKELALSDFQKACDLGDEKGCKALKAEP
ncbi:MAG TPA: tetratricopeptide repeat protein [Nitrospirota bacterium]|nr:tetratricopeptide repeat protein [Nitrospirota bacterium]HUK99869.1 tetratricopeptide repeat protein [Nitrospirota bacterium]